MTFDPNAQLDPGQITDRRGMGGRGGVATVGGGLGLILVLAYALLGGNPNDLGPLLEPGAVSGPGSSVLATDCKSGADANTRDDCRILGFVNSVQAYWTGAFKSGQYEPVNTVLFSDQTSTGCGTASAASGPFYCPPDKLVYLDLGFFQDLREKYGATAGPFAQGYVVAHEYGHHVQDLLGLLGTPKAQGEGATGGSVRTELQADCYAGVWASHAEAGILAPVTDAEIADALDAAAAVGDDRIQK
jgi:predicted metalloprotease